MAEIKLKVSEDLGRMIKACEDVEWLISDIISERLAYLFVLKRLAKKSKLTEEEALELGKFVNKQLAKRYEKFLK